MVKPVLSEPQAAAVTRAIEEAERRTSAEIVAVVTHQSHDYQALSLLIGLAAALAGALGLWWLRPELSFPALCLVQIALLAGFAWLADISGLAAHLTPDAMKQAAAARHAREQFHRLSLHTTRNRAALLLFVSMREHYVELLCDTGLAAHEPETAWQEIIERFIASVKAGRLSEGFIEAIHACGERAARHFPPDPADRNELSDRPVER